MTSPDLSSIGLFHESATCNLYERKLCKSCSLLKFNDGSRIATKEVALKDVLAKSMVATRVLEPLFLARTPWGSRTKLKLLVGGPVDSPRIGIVDSQFNITDLVECPLPAGHLADLLKTLRGEITCSNLTPYNIKERKGELKGIIVLSNASGTKAIVRFILRSSEAIQRVKKCVSRIKQAHPWVKVVSCNIQPLPAAIPEGEVEEILTEDLTITEQYGRFSLCFGPQSFMQVTHECTEALYERVGKIAQEVHPDSVLDLFCGVGGFSLSVAPYTKRVLGIELSRNAVECAKKNALLNGARHAEFTEADLTTSLGLVRDSDAQVVIVNPPRRGLSEELCALLMTKALQKTGAEHLVYSSCNAESLCRDISRLSSAYDVMLIAPFDMFPLTNHTEVLAHLRRRGA
jgi:23S rRNA (uracil747-C5)-methyltransferase